MRLRLDLSYVGTRYHGWQRQENALGVQQVVEEALGRILGEPVEVVGAGRTDAGVHARAYVAHCDIGALPLELGRLAYALNRVLPSDIAVERIAPARDDFHARFDATWREYEYVIARRKLPFLEGFSYRYEGALDLPAMREASALLLDWHDYGCFCKTGSDACSMVCRVMVSEWRADDDVWVYRVRADRFLRGMVRAIVGSLLEVGRGAMTLEGFRAVLASGDRARAGANVPACGLSMVGVGY